jgi:hypothetical protein
MIQEQCFTCGFVKGTQLSKKLFNDINKLHDFDSPLYYEYKENRYSDYLQNKNNYSEKRDNYDIYLKSNEWKVKRDFIISRDIVCVDCKINKSKEVHHLTYDRIFNESNDDLIGLCCRCHGKRHGIDRE